MNKTNHTFITGKAESPSMMVIGLHILKMNNSPQAGNFSFVSYMYFVEFQESRNGAKIFSWKEVGCNLIAG